MAVEARPRRYSIGYTKFSRYARVVGIVSCLVLFTLIGPVAGEEWHDTNEGHGTTHEQLGQQHYPSVDLTAYKSKIRYTSELNRTSWMIKPAFNLSQFFFDHTITDTPSLPRGKLPIYTIWLNF